jgi:fructan beta-fructosidase
LRFDFETGDLQDWAIVDGRLDLVVCERPSLPAWPHVPFNKQGKYHLSTVATRGGKGADDAMTGIIESPVITLRGDKISFLIGGGNSDKTYVALCTVDGQELMRAGGTNSPVLRRVVWDVGKYRGQQAVLRVVDQKQQSWAHLTFDDFSTDAQVDHQATERRRSGGN